MSRFRLLLPVLALSLAGCTSALVTSTPTVITAASTTIVGPSVAPAAANGGPIQHIVVIMQENRSFDHLFNGFPGADTVQSGMSKGAVVPLTAIPLGNTPDVDHSHTNWWRQWNNGAMDGFANEGTTFPYSYVQPSDTALYWKLAQQYTLGDRMFQSNTGPSFVAHQYMIAGQSGGASENPGGSVWGCDAPAGTTVPLIGPNGTDLPGVFPCFDYMTMADLLDARGISWKYYAPGPTTDQYFIISAFQAIRSVRYGPDWTNNVISPETNVITDINQGKLAQVTWIVPAFNNSDHPGAPAQGPDWVGTIVNAIGASQYWDNTVIFIAWDDWGGWYDHVNPPQIDNMGLGFRVPVIVVSPYAKHGYVSHITHEASGFLRYMEEVFQLPSLGARDSIADDFNDCFNYSQTPAAYTQLKTGHTPEFFLRQKPSGPPDDD
jgi:phospholipase C